MTAKKDVHAFKIKKIGVVPLICVFIFLAMVIMFNQFSLKRTVNDYMVKIKVREGKMAVDYIFDQLAGQDFADTNDLSQKYEQYVKDDAKIRSLTVMNNDTVVASFGAAMPKDLEPYSANRFGRGENYEKVAFSTSGNNAIVRGEQSHFDLDFGLTPWRENGDYAGNNNQDIWYSQNIDGMEVTVAYAVPLTYSDYQLCAVFSVFFMGTGIIIFIVIILLVCRIIQSQNGLIRAFYADRETGGHNWYYFTSTANRRLRHLYANNKADNAAVIQIRFVKYDTFASCNGEEATKQLLTDIYGLIKRGFSKKTIVARNERADFAALVTYDSRETLLFQLEESMKHLTALHPDMMLVFKFGVYLLDQNEQVDATEAYLRALIACNKIEASVDETICFFNDEMKSELEWETKMENDLERGLANREFEVFLQPKHACDDEQLAAAEALVRWNHPTEGFLTPYKFIPVFEKTGQIVRLDDYMISNVARIQSEFLARGERAIPISVNLSRTNFTRSGLAEHICALIDEYHVPHELIEIELTESSFFDDQNLIIRTAQQLRENGFEVSLDDFGAGYSSLNSLRNIPIDVVKLDAGFFRGADMDKRGDIIVNEVIRLAKQLDIRIVAEGIEERSQVDFLKEAGCDLIQGYYFAKPMSLSDYEERYLRADN